MTLDVLAIVGSATPPGRLRRNRGGGGARSDGTHADLLELADVSIAPGGPPRHSATGGARRGSDRDAGAIPLATPRRN